LDFCSLILKEVFNKQEVVRREALSELRSLGIDPFPPQEFKVNALSAEIKSNFDPEKENFQDVQLAGRIMSMRGKGKVVFAELQDSQGRIQLYIKRDIICEGEDKTLFEKVVAKLLDLGDYVGVKGETFTTKTGETTIRVKEFVLLSKSLKVLPIVKVDAEGNTHDAFTDPELRYRQRYVDLTVNSQYRDIFVKRAQIIKEMRRFFDDKGWLEVETPVLQPIHGGAAARPFATHHNSLDMPLYMRIANELYLKRLIVAGFDGVYEIGKMFRNEGMDRTHNPEFTSMEIYVAYKDYIWMMEMVEQCIEQICRAVHDGASEITYDGKLINFAGPYERLTMYESIEKYTGIDISQMSEDEMRQVCKDLHITVDPSMGRGKLIDEIFGEKVEEHLIQPTYIIDYPIEMTPLAKKHRTVEGLVERFELFVNGKEIANAYTELNDPIDQRERFEDQLNLAKRGDDEAMVLDEDFIRALEYGMPVVNGSAFYSRGTFLSSNES